MLGEQIVICRKKWESLKKMSSKKNPYFIKRADLIYRSEYRAVKD